MAFKTASGTATTSFTEITFADTNGVFGSQLAMHNKGGVVLLLRGDNGDASTGTLGSEWELAAGAKESYPIKPGDRVWIAAASGTCAYKALGTDV